MMIEMVLMMISMVGLSLLGGWLFLKKILGKRQVLWLDNENRYLDPNLETMFPFPSLSSTDSVYLSLIVPSYNEQERLPKMLDEALQHLKQRQKADPSFTWEILVVDDGSRDATTKVALEYCKRETADRIRVLTLAANRGKGGAVQRGMMCARGRYLLMADADGATQFRDLDRLEEKMKQIEKNNLSIGIGSRAHLQEEAVAKRSLFRNFLMYGFHILVSVLGIRGIRDTQCGFKLFSRKAAQTIIPLMHIQRWAFDVELIYLGEHFQIPMVEVPVNWTEIPGSKLSPLEASLQMGKDLLLLRLAYISGIWRTDNPIQE